MLTMDEVTTIRTLKNKGRSIKYISTALGISKNTVRKYLRNEEALPTVVLPCKYQELKSPKKSQWHEYYDEIVDMLVNKGYCGTRIFDELQSLGAKGKRSAFYEYLRWIRSNNNNHHARARFETQPGEQAQWDWTEYTVPFGKGYRKIYIFTIILGYSRYRFSLASLDCTLPTVLTFLIQAFEYFGGTCRELLMDNAKQMVSNPNRKHFAWNPRFLKLMAHYDVEPKACLVRHSWTKGKVENPFRYLENHFIKGRSFDDLDDLNIQLKAFNETINTKHHQGIQTKPIDLFSQEKPFLSSIPDDQFIDIQQLVRKVRNDCLISYKSNHYSVPFPYAMKTVLVAEYLGDKLIIQSLSGERIAIHDLCFEKGRRIINQDHYKGLIEKYSKSGCVARFEEIYPKDMKILDDLQSLYTKDWKSFLSRSLRMLDLYSPVQVKKALEYCIQKKVIRVSVLKLYLSTHFDIISETSDLPIKTKDLPYSMDGVKRNLEDYNQYFIQDEQKEVSNGTI